MIAFNPVWKGHYDILTHIKRVAKLVIFYPPMYTTLEAADSMGLIIFI